jgi:hypothetical protein
MITPDNIDSPGSGPEVAAGLRYRHLRPTTPPELMDRAITVLTNRFPELGLLALLAAIPDFIGLFVQPQIIEATRTGRAPDLSVLLMLLGLYVLAILPGTALVAGTFLGFLRPTRRLSIPSLFQFAFSRWGTMVLAQFLLVGALLILLSILGELRGAGGGGSLLSAILAAVALYWAIRFVLAWPMIIVEGRGIWAALQRSSLLTAQSWTAPAGDEEKGPSRIQRSAFSRQLMMLILPLIAMAVVSNSISVLLPSTADSRWIPAGLNLISSLFLSLLLAAGVTALYTDAVSRAEGWDLEIRMLAYEESLVSHSDPESETNPVTPEPDPTEPK